MCATYFARIDGLMREFNKVGIIGYTDKVLVKGTVSRLARFLLEEGVEVHMEIPPNQTERMEGVTYSTRAEIGDICELAIVVGGDGSLLHAARDLVEHDISMLGVNRGRLGFLTDIAPQEPEQPVRDILNGKYIATERFLLEAELCRGDACIQPSLALNDVVIQPRGSIRMIQFTLNIDGQYVYTQRSDGLIVSTPTGSTAYALSGGGSIMHPNLDAINLVPINPHTLSSRPIVVNANAELEIVIERDSSVDAQVVCDGQRYMEAELGDCIRVRRKARGLKLLHPVDHNFYATCRSKLNWASD